MGLLKKIFKVVKSIAPSVLGYALLGPLGATIANTVQGGVKGGLKGALLGGATSILGGGIANKLGGGSLISGATNSLKAGGALGSALSSGAGSAVGGATAGASMNGVTNDSLLGLLSGGATPGASMSGVTTGSMLDLLNPSLDMITVKAGGGATDALSQALGGSSTGTALNQAIQSGAQQGGATGGPEQVDTTVSPIEVTAQGGTGGPMPVPMPPMDLSGAGGDRAEFLDFYDTASGRDQYGRDPNSPTDPGNGDMAEPSIAGNIGRSFAGDMIASNIVGTLAQALGLTPKQGGATGGVPGATGTQQPGTSTSPIPGSTATPQTSATVGSVPMPGSGVRPQSSPFSAGKPTASGAPAAMGQVDIQSSTKPNIFPWVKPEQMGAF